MPKPQINAVSHSAHVVFKPEHFVFKPAHAVFKPAYAVQQVTYLAKYVEIAAAGSESKIESAGMPVRSTGAATYEIQCKVHDNPAPFENAKSSTSSRTTVEGLTPGTLYAFQVCALGAAGPGPYSDEAVKRAP